MPLDGVDPLPAPIKVGCLYLLADHQPCGCARQLKSPYCGLHHALCHIVAGSPAERSRLAEIETAAEFVGGRVSRATPRVPPQRFMRALDERQRKR
jgi:hypothetical protein